MKELIDGLTILMPYYDGNYNVGADHDVIYAYGTDRPLLPEDVERLHGLGWRQRGVKPPAYEPGDPWRYYV